MTRLALGRAESARGPYGPEHRVVHVEPLGADVDDAGLEPAVGTGDRVEHPGKFALGVVVPAVARLGGDGDH